MPDIINAILLGIVQGLTEFLPVSSSGHTALSTIVVFRKDIVTILTGLVRPGEDREHQWFSLKIILSMIPAAAVGILFADQIESLFTANMIYCCWLIKHRLLTSQLELSTH